MEEIPMNSSLIARRQKLLRELARVNRQIARTQKSMMAIEGRIALLAQANAKAA
jgi:hypothetical protein